MVKKMTPVRISLLSLTLANAYLYDVLFPHYKSTCSGGCDAWTQHASVFADGKVPTNAGSQCALVSGKSSNPWPWCFCNGSPKTCQPPKKTVEQLNLQMARHDVVVAAFITYESISGKPTGMLGTSKESMEEVTGESHPFSSFSSKVSHDAYAMHYVPFRNLTSRQTYFYKVKSGSGDWSDTFSFRMPGQTGSTKIAIYGDMGVDAANNMGNLKDDCESGGIDAVLHMGDHAYHWQDHDDKTGDGYLNYFQPVLQSCPWVPIIGNHEGAESKRFDAITKGLPIGQKEVDEAFHTMNFTSTADTALGHHLSLGSLLGAALHSKVPSGSSRYMSTDIGLVHVVALDTKWSGKVEKSWVEKDLAAAHANRDKVPWIVVINHYPGYIQSKTEEMMLNASTKAYFSDDGEYDRNLRYRTCDAMGQNASECQTVGDWQVQVQDGLEPLYLKYGVDLVGGGHHHHYQVTWPMKNNKECQTNYNKPTCPVYFTEGNGGVPGRCSHKCQLTSCTTSWCRIDGNNCGAYGRITATKTSLRYDHVENSNGKITDAWTLTKGSAPPSPAPPSPPSPTPPAPPSPPPPTPTPPPVPPPSPPTPTPPAPPPAPPSPPGRDTLKVKDQLNSGDTLISASGNARLSMQKADGNLVLHDGSKALWSSKTSGHPGAYVVLQGSDGNLVIHDSSKKVLWASGTNSGAVKAVLGDDCNLVIVDANAKTLWSTQTSCTSSFVV